MKIIVTGGAGYIGSHAVYSLIDKGHEVIVLDNLEKGSIKNIHPESKFYKIDLRNIKEIQKVLQIEKNIDGIMHFAGYIVVPESVIKPLEYFRNNVHSVENLLRCMTEYNIKNIVFSSTAAVYGEPKSIPIKETDQKSPLNPYGESKLAAELMINSWAKSVNANSIIFRYFNVAGTRKDGNIGIRGNELTHLLPLINKTALKLLDQFTIFGNNYNTKDGTCIRDFIHVVDLVEAHIIGLEWAIKNNLSNTFNLGSGSGYSVLEVLNEAKKTLKLEIPYQVGKRRSGDPATLLADVSNAYKILKWKSKKTLAEMIQTDFSFREMIKNENK